MREVVCDSDSNNLNILFFITYSFFYVEKDEVNFRINAYISGVWRRDKHTEYLCLLPQK